MAVPWCWVVRLCLESLAIDVLLLMRQILETRNYPPPRARKRLYHARDQFLRPITALPRRPGVPRAALTMYEKSAGKVLLLAVVDSSDVRDQGIVPLGGPNNGPSNGRQAESFVSNNSTSGALRGGGGGGGTRGGGERRQPEAHLEAEVFPDDEDFQFSIDCHLLFLAETQSSVEDLIFRFQVRVC